MTLEVLNLPAVRLLARPLWTQQLDCRPVKTFENFVYHLGCSWADYQQSLTSFWISPSVLLLLALLHTHNVLLGWNEFVKPVPCWQETQWRNWRLLQNFWTASAAPTEENIGVEGQSIWRCCPFPAIFKFSSFSICLAMKGDAVSERIQS